MLRKLFRWSTILVVVAMFASMMTGMAIAAPMTITPTGMGPDEAMSPGEWAPVSAGERHWFVFQYDGEENPIKVSLFAKPANGAQFKVLTEAQADVWRRTGKIEWTGAGATNSAEKGDMFWTGEFNKAGRYYVLVEHSRQIDKAAWCMLQISGKGVSFLGGEPATAPVAPTEIKPILGSGPDMAFKPGVWQEMVDGQRNWFAFTYDKDAADPMIEVKLYSKHMEGLGFRILTPEGVELWRRTGEIKCVGCGSPNEFDSSDLSWKGSFTTSGTYYVVIEHKQTGQESAWGKIMVTGEGVTF